MAELRVWKQGGEVVTRRQHLDVGGWLSGLDTQETLDFYKIAAAKALVPPNPWGSQIMDWVEYNRDCPAEDKQRIKSAMQGCDTFSFIFPGEDLTCWYGLRKNVIKAGFLEGRPVSLNADNSSATLNVTFQPQGDLIYEKRFEVTLEHGRKYLLVHRGQGTSDEELCR